MQIPANSLEALVSPEVTISDIRNDFKSGKYSVTELTEFYLNRIESIDKSGPQLNAVLTINPDALAIAKKLDAEYKAGKIRGPLHGIPVLLKDNINTGDKMPCTAGARSMKDSYPNEDSPLAAQLRKAGAVILGKANLSEWANFHSFQSSSGWSGLGGQTLNPYKLAHNPCGSSAGSGAGVSANLCVIAIGSETNGSITCPANNNGVVGIKPTVGLISRTGIIPISHTQDTGGPMARSVEDAAIALGTMTATDSADSKTMQEGRVALSDYTPHLKKDGLKGKRIGYYKYALKDDKDTELDKLMQQNLNFLKKAGATIIDIDSLLLPETGDHSFQVLLYEFKDGLNKYFKSLGADAPVKSLEELISVTFDDPVEMKYHDHMLLKTAQEKGDLNSEEYLTALAKMTKQSQAEGIDKAIAEHNLDAFVAPTGSPAWKTSLQNGDTFGVFSSSPAAIAGYPNISVPMGQIGGLPVGMSIFGTAWSEPSLIEIAYAFEQGTHHRFTPTFIK